MKSIREEKEIWGKEKFVVTHKKISRLEVYAIILPNLFFGFMITCMSAFAESDGSNPQAFIFAGRIFYIAALVATGLIYFSNRGNDSLRKIIPFLNAASIFLGLILYGVIRSFVSNL